MDSPVGNETMDSDVMQLGGNIELSGFSEFDGATMIVLKKVIGNYARKIADNHPTFKKLSIHVKKVHEREKSEKYEITVRCDAERLYPSDVVDRNLFFAVDSALKKILHEMGHQ